MRKKIILAAIILIVAISTYMTNGFDFIRYSADDFNIISYHSLNDRDHDGIDDQSDMLNSALEYVETRPVYKSKYYAGGYPDDEYGVCTDVLAFAMLNSGYDLQQLVHEDITAHPEDYDIETPDPNIDFRRVRNLIVFFANNYQPLSTDENDYTEWQAGDIVIIAKHVGIVSDVRNRNGIPYLIHNNGNGQYVQNIMNHYNIVGHYRLDLKKE